MPKRKIPAPPQAPASGLPGLPGLLELDRFSAAALEKWTEASRDLDQLSASLYFETEPERRRYREGLLSALRAAPVTGLEFSSWARIVTYRYSLAPLSCAGSLHDVGGRFNACTDLDDRTLEAWPALYIAEDYETAFREKFQLASHDTKGGLKAQDLALTPNASHATVVLRGKLSNVFPLMDDEALKPVCRVFRRFKMPAAATRLQKKLKIPNRHNFMIRSPVQLRQALLAQNWRLPPAGTPSEQAAWVAMPESSREAVNRVFANMGKSIAAFERNISYGESRFDRYAEATVTGDGRGQEVLSQQEVRGLRLFLTKGQCVTCHNGPLLTDHAFHNTGIPPINPASPDRGRADGLRKLLKDEFNCLGRYSDATPDQCGELQFLATNDPGQLAAFRTPSLRNVAERAPYMHAGQFASVEEVVEHYARSPKAVL